MKFNNLYKRQSVYLLLLIMSLAAAGTTVYAGVDVIPKGAVWKYFDNGTDPGTVWMNADFDDTEWKSGKAQLGYGDGDEGTIISFGPDGNNKYPAYYFRHKFNIENMADFKYCQMKIVRDDGAIVYLNGHEIHRVNMPSGPVNYKTFANGEGTDASFFPIEFTPEVYSYLQPGENIIAVEVHQGGPTSSDLSFDLVFTASATPPEQGSAMRKMPYLIYEGKNTEMSVLWQLTRTVTCKVNIGKDKTYSLPAQESAEYNTDHQHKVTFNNLEPGMKYFYRVIAENDTIENDFFAAPDTNSTKVKILSYGDSRSFPEAHNALAAKILESFEEGYQTISLGVGDYCDDGGSEESWDTEYFSPDLKNVRKLMGSISIQGGMGDHEDDGDGGILYRKYFAYPFSSQFGKYWSIEYGPALIICLDQYASISKTSIQLKWMEKLLASTTKKWKIVTFHEPGWSTGDHENNTGVQNTLQPLFEKYNVQLVLTGHNHLYSRASVNGIKHITTGGGGAPLTDPRPKNENPNVDVYAQEYHYCKIDIDGDELAMTVLGTNGNIIDNFKINSITSANDDELDASTPKSYKLFEAYPNPFNPSTTLSFSLPERAKTILQIFDQLGRLVETSINADLEKGVYHYKWNASGLASGIYFCKITAGNFSDTKKLVMIK